MGDWNSIPDLPAMTVVRAPDIRALTDLAKVTAETYLAYKLSDQSTTNNSTFFGDSDLVLPVAANATFHLGTYVKYNCNSTADWKGLWSAPSGSAMEFWSLGYDVSDTFGLHTNILGTTQAAGGSGSDRAYLMYGTLVTGSSAGVLQLTWAQNTANASTTTVRAGSYLRLDRVG